MIKLMEMANVTFTLDEVLKDVKKIPTNYNPEIGEVYHTYVGRFDQPDVYDKRSCFVFDVDKNNAYVFKIVKDIKENVDFRSTINDYEEVNLDAKRQISIERKPYKIDKKWLRTYDGSVSYRDLCDYNEKYNKLKNTMYFQTDYKK